ncbi:MAG: DinB family protein [Chloroflexota bacterium]
MNQQINPYWETFQMYKMLRAQLFEILSDEDLAYSPGGDNMTFGELLVELGETEMNYIESFKTFKMAWSNKNDDPSRAGSLAKLNDWYGQLHAELQGTLEAISEEDVQTKTVDRGDNFKLPIHIQINVLQEAYLIFYGKAMVYLKAMQKERPEQWTSWIG